MNKNYHIFYPSPREEDVYCQSCRKFTTSKTSGKEWGWLTQNLGMTTRVKELIEREFKRLFQEWYQPKEVLILADVKVYEGDACLVTEKVLEEFAVMQSKHSLLSKESSHLESNNPTHLAPGIDPGHVLVSEELKHHTYQLLCTFIRTSYPKIVI
ncbi:hypothetical protein DSO57_1015902 [Entomophthora muscae]|uniref:Uncharacterized protein n=1 Tax=Entomophthora muscae TaxID=34485 RepID=A0ACC2RW27_9FUNG|nr:hypothetical protein DSO57_1015902 [Entomophthora muscae]